MYVAAFVTSTLLQSLRFGRPDKKIVYTVTLFAVCVIYRDYPKIIFSSLIAYVYTYTKSLTFLIVFTVTRFSGDVINDKMMTKLAQRHNKKIIYIYIYIYFKPTNSLGIFTIFFIILKSQKNSNYRGTSQHSSCGTYQP